jgi:hypothetical protein
MAARHRSIAVLIGTVCAATPLLSSAQTTGTDASSGAAPDSAARLSYLDGSVSVLPPGAKQWDKAFLNRPLSTGDQLWSDTASRAELELGGVVVRVSAKSEISMLAYSAQGLQLGVNVGTVDVALHYAGGNQSFEIDTPQLAMALQRDGDYRIAVDLDGATTVLVHSGATHLTSRSGEGISLRDGQGVVFAADGTLDVADARSADSFDHWCTERDTLWKQQNAQASEYVPSDVPGAEQLSDNGQWSNQPDGSDVWYPNQVPPGWAPYQVGRWAWVHPWGWTWIDRASWGFATFHYGHWATINGRWGWIPPSSRGGIAFTPALAATPASVTSAGPKPELAARGSAPPSSVALRPVIAMHNPVSTAVASLPRVVLAAPAPARAAEYVPIPSPIGPTIYARDVRPSESVVPPPPPMRAENLVHAPATSVVRTSSATAGPPITTPELTRLPHPTSAAPTAMRPARSAPQSAQTVAPKPAHAAAPVRGDLR